MDVNGVYTNLLCMFYLYSSDVLVVNHALFPELDDRKTYRKPRIVKETRFPRFL